ncbi:VOC family protein [Oceanicola sp. S124]|uniref:VOC family protein n=1 Tax=Oceanicola sp. S124 TaxID=1042378 RepID=UPI0002557E01|nr:VOC family protein [Oceanicola sp. S124]
MISYVTVGADDIGKARRFYDALLPALGYGLTLGPEGLSYVLPVPPGIPAPPDFYVKPTFDGGPASAGNGAMVAFEATSQAQVRQLHAAALAAGGTDEGAPGFRAAYGPRFYVCYLRDPQGNKLALFSSQPDEPGRDDAPAPG